MNDHYFWNSNLFSSHGGFLTIVNLQAENVDHCQINMVFMSFFVITSIKPLLLCITKSLNIQIRRTCIIMYINGKQFRCSVFTFVQYIWSCTRLLDVQATSLLIKVTYRLLCVRIETDQLNISSIWLFGVWILSLADPSVAQLANFLNSNWLWITRPFEFIYIFWPTHRP